MTLQLRKSTTNKKKRRVNIADQSTDLLGDQTANNESIKMVNKSPRTIEVLKKVLQEHFLLKALRDINPIMNALQMHVALPGEVIVWQVTKWIVHLLTHSCLLTHPCLLAQSCLLTHPCLLT